ncbi:hypothetical protein CC1G_06326 [Coprinopsis cinerea okayama7|uniref:Uncharacterized protein n=1 Tax=Coprinopsis cinerea (strain Okayama-7 / 130 / ATCC MYA-4618 / FGSC 9003) TaxID=240176 RepID=A8NTI9_COPC7|nr:hypothetical protein CC1G_06326 [Coprinopsis cinerea okayama7\|eukprot:XP_001836241.2 hypothetical protein CC1G_06326 [Coprinopsis cinerea okayama7\
MPHLTLAVMVRDRFACQHRNRGPQGSLPPLNRKGQLAHKTCPINQLPTEILEYIFVTTTTPTAAFLADHFQTRFSILRVCKLWNAVALSCPALWAVYYPNAAQLPHSKEILSRSVNHPLSLKLFSLDQKECPGFEETYRLFTDLAPRWHDLDIYLYDCMSLDFTAALPKTAPDFTTLKLDMTECLETAVAEVCAGIARHCSSLRHLEFRSAGIYFKAFVQLPWSQLASLSLVTSISEDEAGLILSVCTNASEVSLSVVKPSRGSSAIQENMVAVHPNLLHLRIGFLHLDPADFLSHFTTPALRTLDIQCSKSTLSNLSRFKSFLLRSKCQLESFGLGDNGYMRDPSLAASIVLLEPLQTATVLNLKLQRIRFRAVVEAVQKLRIGHPILRFLRSPGPGAGGVYVDRRLDKTRAMYY